MKYKHKPLEIGAAQTIRRYQAMRMSPFRCLCELIDNALDAGATLIEIVVEKRKLICRDNGHGCDDIERMLRLGVERQRAEGVSSLYGAGGTLAGLKLSDGGRVTYQTIHGDQKSIAILDWPDMKRRDVFEAAEIDIVPCSEPTGTIITCEGHEAKWDAAETRENLGFEYAAAIRAGRRIRLDYKGKSSEIVPYDRPVLSETIEFTFDFPGNEEGEIMPIAVWGGIVADWRGRKGRQGWHVRFANRTSLHSHEPATLRGQSATSLYFEVVLPPSWTNITLTKDGIANGEDEFMAMISDRCTDLIDRAGAKQHQLDVARIGDKISEIMAAAVAGAREKRQPTDHPGEGAHSSTGSGRRRENFRETQEGGVVVAADAAGKCGWFNFRFADIEEPIWVQISRGKAVINFSTKFPHLQQFQSLDPGLLISQVASAFCSEVAHLEKQSWFGFEPGTHWIVMLQRILECIPAQPRLKIVS